MIGQTGISGQPLKLIGTVTPQNGHGTVFMREPLKEKTAEKVIKVVSDRVAVKVNNSDLTSGNPVQLVQ